MNEFILQPIDAPDPEVISEWVWVCRQWPISLSKWMEIGPDLKEQARRFVEPEAVIRF